MNDSYDSLLNDVHFLLKQNAQGKPPKITLARETVSLLESISLAEKTAPVSPSENITVFDTGGIYDAVSDVESPPQALAEEVPGPLTDSLADVAADISACQRCSLTQSRLHTVPGEGNSDAALVFVGEAPGASEDQQGRPFVGRAGQLLTDIISKGMKIKREDVFICNVLKCRPPGNRTPNPEEVAHCEPYLLRQLEIIRPKVICALGAVAAQTLLKTTDPIFKLRGKWHDYHGIAFRVTYHPAYLLRNPADKAKVWQDVQEIMRYLGGETVPGR